MADEQEDANDDELVRTPPSSHHPSEDEAEVDEVEKAAKSRSGGRKAARKATTGKR